MTSESISSKVRVSLTDEPPSVESASNVLRTEGPSIEGMISDPVDEADGADEYEDAAFAKAQTLMMDLEEESGPDSVAFRTTTDSTPKYYVQGVVLGQRACIITNLLGGDSQTLFQPQMVWTIGRNRDAALPLRDRVLSRRHAVILYVPEEGFYLVDLNSMNGSFVNGSRIQQRQLLKDGDRLRIGGFEFSFFTSRGSRSIEAIHPEVLARFTSSKARSEAFMDYAALEEPELLFGTTTSTKE